MSNRYQFVRRICSLAWIAIAHSASAQATFDLATDYSGAQNPRGAWAFGWMAPSNNVFNPYATPVAAYGLSLNEWRGPFPSDNGSAPPNVILNPTDAAITVSDTTWLPHQVTFHPGEQGERSVIRWTSPLTGRASLAAAFEGRSSYASSGVEIYQNGALLFAAAVSGTGAGSRVSFDTNLVIRAGDTIDFQVDYGNGDWTSDTTQISAVISAVPEPPLTLLPLDSSSARLAWPTNTQGYLLEFANQLPASQWTTVTNPLMILGDRFAVTISTTNPSQFFRLRKQ